MGQGCTVGCYEAVFKPQLLWVVAQTVEGFAIEPIDADRMCWAEVKLSGAQLFCILDQVTESRSNPGSIWAAVFLMRSHLQKGVQRIDTSAQFDSWVSLGYEVVCVQLGLLRQLAMDTTTATGALGPPRRGGRKCGIYEFVTRGRQAHVHVVETSAPVPVSGALP